MNTTLIKAAVKKSFSLKASAYAKHASVQERTAQALAEFIQDDIARIPEGPILEIGCGTGIFTAHLLNLFADRLITASDSSQPMLDQCVRELNPASDRVQLLLMDAESCTFEQKYALVAASLSLQWMTDFYATLNQLLTALKPDGQLVFSVPVQGSFDEWRNQCIHADVAFTVNTLPARAELIDWCRQNALTLKWTQQAIVCKYTSALEFFRSLKGVGASVNTNGSSLTSTQLRRLIQGWDVNCNGNVELTYQILCARITREYEK